MNRWTGIVVASAEAAVDEMRSRLPTYLHPIAGRPLVWHVVSDLARLDPAPEKVIVVGGNLQENLFSDIPHPRIGVVGHEQLGDFDAISSGEAVSAVVVVDASASVPSATLLALVESARGSWLGAGDSVLAARLEPHLVPEVLRVSAPLQSTRGVLLPSARLPDVPGAFLVRDRMHLAEVGEAVRARLVAAHMAAGATFLLPDSVLVDVDVRIGVDTVIYPGVVLEGDTTIGAETVVGPGCRIIDSWIGSGVELKGWNYVSHTSVRNRAILEPYVRRGFD